MGPLSGSKLFAVTLLVTLITNSVTMPAFSAPPAKSFGALPAVYDAAISPDGTHIAVIVNVKGAYAVLIRTTRKSAEKPWLQPLGEEVKPRYVKWVNNRRYVVSIAQSENYYDTPFTATYLYSSDRVTKEPKLLAKPKGFFRQFNDRVVDWLEDDPEHILMAYSDKSRDPYPDIKKVNVISGRDRTVKRGVIGIQRWITDTNGTPRIGKGTREDGTKRMLIYNPATKKWTTAKNTRVSRQTPAFTAF